MTNPDILLIIKYGERIFADNKRIRLLKEIAKIGSLSQAAKAIGISYKTAWDAINEINQLSDTPFVITSTGGKGGGGTKLSSFALRFIELYDLLSKMQHNAFDILKNNAVPLNDILKVAATLSFQSSARNQWYGSIRSLQVNEVAGFITILLQDQQTEVQAYITQSSIMRLQLSVGKNVMLLVKALQIEFCDVANGTNCFKVTVDNMVQSQHWVELTLSSKNHMTFYATRPIEELVKYGIKCQQDIAIYINPENIIIATVI